MSSFEITTKKLSSVQRPGSFRNFEIFLITWMKASTEDKKMMSIYLKSVAMLFCSVKLEIKSKIFYLST